MAEQPSYYAIIPANVRYDKDLCANAKLLYGEITALAQSSGKCFASNDYFSKLYGVSKTSITKWVKSLCEKGYISSELIYKQGSKEILHRYLTLVVYPTQEKLHTPTQEKLRDNNTSINNTRVNKENKEKIELPSCINQEVWNEWVQHRKEIKKALTPSTIKKQLKQLEDFNRLGMDTTEVINASIAGGYAGLFALRTGKKYESTKSKVSTTMSAYDKLCAEREGQQNVIEGEIL